ncbi:amidohydrolase family protein [Acidiferrimicrobium sp. IK]|uniref:amidohydrolase family protein n=1 Tax=Acidiferrimicrobium sp. IK TaxID=2871700 RepID=UPI0021CB306C|nr:amidohydrolase family protein [Acidiferrimicrobium sp. IK]MCU4183277.1 amidohydrolase family protein [Acidiferrimicrobium sp. IK]
MVFDVLSSVVPTPEAFGYAEMTLARLRGYQQHFGSPRDKIPLAGDSATQQRVMEESYQRGVGMCPDEERFMAMLDDGDVATAVIYTEMYETSLGVKSGSNDDVAKYVARHPDRLLGLGGVDPWKDDAVDEVHRLANDLGLRGVVVSPFKQKLLPAEARMARVFSACEKLGIPVFLHSGINWWVDTTYEIGHPRHLDELASSFPDLKIVCLHAGWPWVSDMVMVAWRHANVYLDISAHRPSHMPKDESGWGPLLYWGDRVLSDRIVFGSTWTLMSSTPAELAGEVRALPLKDATIDKWLSGNARRLFGME